MTKLETVRAVMLVILVLICSAAVTRQYLTPSPITVHENQIVRAITYCQGNVVGQDPTAQNSIDYLIFKGEEVLVVCENGAFTALKTFMGNANAK